MVDVFRELSELLGRSKASRHRAVPFHRDGQVARRFERAVLHRLQDRRVLEHHAADAAAIYQRKLWAEQEKQSLEEMEAHGVEIIYPDKQPFMDAAAPMIERFKNDPVFHDLIDQIQNTHEKDN